MLKTKDKLPEFRIHRLVRHPTRYNDRAGLSFRCAEVCKALRWARKWPAGALYLIRSGEMNDELQDLLNAGYKPVLVGPQPFSFDELLRNVDPAPDEETERFVAAIYADRCQAVENSSPE